MVTVVDFLAGLLIGGLCAFGAFVWMYVLLTRGLSR
jgi:hypothetical protein